MNPKNLSKIPDYAFVNREDLTDLVLPSNITEIGERAFFKCINLKSITLPEKLEYIAASAFSECENLEEIILPKNIKKIGYRAFADCKRLKRIVIPEGVEKLDWALFAGCENLEEVVLPESLKEIGKQLFLNCKKLKKVNTPSTITSLPDECFKGCNNIDIVLNSNIKKLGNRVFEDCYKLSTFPSEVETFGENCFRNCRNITSVNLNDKVTILPDGLFDGCVNLNNIKSRKKLNIGKRCFRNCKSLKEIPDVVNCFNEQAFENCINLTKIDVINNTIPFACFRGCKNLKEIQNQENIYSMDSFAFAGCESLESFDIYNLSVVPAEAFSGCTNLKKVRLRSGISAIEARAFYNCQNLTDINLPDTIEIIKKEAFSNCKSIKSITIPANLEIFNDAAFAYMDSLECINVSPQNKTFSTPDHKILILDLQQKLVLYASGSKDKTYSLKDYNINYEALDQEIIKPITGIGTFAFAGAKNLEELTLCACTQDIEATAFYECPKLKKLNVEGISLFTSPGFNIRDHGAYYNEEVAKNKVYLPFEEVNIGGNVNTIYSYAFPNFKNIKRVNLPNDKVFNILSFAFADCESLEEVKIPKNVNEIAANAFHPLTKLKFANGLEPTGFVELRHNDKYTNDYKLYVLNNGTFYIDYNDKITKITQRQIDKICYISKEIRDNPVLFLDFMNDLFKHDLAIKQLFSGILMSTMSLENRTVLFENLNKNDQFFLDVFRNSRLLDNKDSNTITLLEKEDFVKVVNYIELLRKYNINIPELHNKFFMTRLDIKDFEELINSDLDLFVKIIKNSKFLEPDNCTQDNKDDKDNKDNKDNKENSIYYLTYQILKNNMFKPFINLVKKYDIKDKYLFEKAFIATCNDPLMESMIKVYDANTKRLLKKSEALSINTSASQNLKDLLTLMKITGALEEDEITRQKAATFISEKIFDEFLPNGNKNEYRIVGDDIHRIFNFPYIREEFDQEFATFFLENYQELMKEERKKSGFIQRVYINFRQISKTCTSNKGSQRKLKVTMNKCINYLLNVKFDGVVKENKKLAKLIGEWYDENNTWLNALRIYNESLSAPRNIFTKIEVNNDGKLIYDMDPKHDLKEEVNSNFSYQWLPKQDYDNLILGKYCNCCAHVEGAGQGIMRASMILDCCQNLVIRNSSGEIISKATLYINKREGYGVFNTVETSMNYRDDESLKNIYNAFMRGCKAFITTYNENNPELPIKNISIGTNRNTILNFLTLENNHSTTPIQESLPFGEYSLNKSGYAGDWNSSQRIVLRKEE